jgi:threonine dehydratase
MFLLWERTKLLVEPTGALGVAALLERSAGRGLDRVGVILSGGNVDLSQVEEWRQIAAVMG